MIFCGNRSLFDLIFSKYIKKDINKIVNANITKLKITFLSFITVLFLNGCSTYFQVTKESTIDKAIINKECKAVKSELKYILLKANIGWCHK